MGNLYLGMACQTSSDYIEPGMKSVIAFPGNGSEKLHWGRDSRQMGKIGHSKYEQ